jgi:hypothetical protein
MIMFCKFSLFFSALSLILFSSYEKEEDRESFSLFLFTIRVFEGLSSPGLK